MQSSQNVAVAQVILESEAVIWHRVVPYTLSNFLFLLGCSQARTLEMVLQNENKKANFDSFTIDK